MLTFIVFVLSGTLILVQLASGQLTPRVVGIVFAMPRVKITLALFSFAYLFTLAALGRVEERVPDLEVSIAILLNVACIVAFFLFVQQLSSGLRSSSMMQHVADAGRHVIEHVYPLEFSSDHPEVSRRQTLAASAADVITFTGRSGVVMAFSVEQLVERAREAGTVIELVPQVGDFIAAGDDLFRIAAPAQGVSAEALRGCVAVGAERTLHQDPRFVFRILVDIASRALSPGINDPTTAVLAVDQIHHLLLCLGRRRLDDGRALDRDGKLRLIYGTPDWPDFVMLAVSEIRQYGEGSIQVNRRLHAMIEHLIRTLPEARRPALQAELALLSSGAARSFPDEEDRKRAGMADFQGIGSSLNGGRSGVAHE